MKTYKTYKIRSGNNYCNRFNLPLPHRPLWKPTEMVAKLTLNESMVYRNENDGWMKLCGFSRGHHHDNSFRFVWRCWNGRFEIAAYVYLNRIREVQIIKSWPILGVVYGSELLMIIRVRYHFISFEIKSIMNGDAVAFSVRNLLSSLGYLLTPHFENPKAEQTGAQHNINIPLEITIRLTKNNYNNRKLQRSCITIFQQAQH